VIRHARPPDKGGFTIKTALLKTNIWDDDTFYGLNIDTKIIYLSFLTAPERGVGRMFKVSDRITSARTGLSVDQINICKKQMENNGLVNFYEGWVNLTDKSSFIQPVKGKLTEITLERELLDIPDDVLDAFLKLTDEISPVKHTSVSGDVHVLDNDNDNVHDKDTDKDYGNKDINEAFLKWNEIVGYKIESNTKRNRNACSNLIKKHGLDGVDKLIMGVSKSQQDKYAPRISDFISLQSKYNDLIAWGKRISSSEISKVVKI